MFSIHLHGINLSYVEQVNAVEPSSNGPPPMCVCGKPWTAHTLFIPSAEGGGAAHHVLGSGEGRDSMYVCWNHYITYKNIYRGLTPFFTQTVHLPVPVQGPPRKTTMGGLLTVSPQRSQRRT